MIALQNVGAFKFLRHLMGYIGYTVREISIWTPCYFASSPT